MLSIKDSRPDFLPRPDWNRYGLSYSVEGLNFIILRIAHDAQERCRPSMYSELEHIRSSIAAYQAKALHPVGVIFDVAPQRVLAVLGPLALAKAHMIRNDHPVCFRKRRNEAAVKVSPGGFTVQAYDWLAYPFLHVVHTTARRLGKVWSEGKCPVEIFVWRNHDGSVAPVSHADERPGSGFSATRI